MFLWAQQDKHGTPGRDEWTESTGLGIAAASGDPAGIESEAGRWRDLPRTARLGERQPGN